MVKKRTVLIMIVTLLISIGISFAGDPPSGDTFSWACPESGDNDECPGCKVNGSAGTPACEAYCDGFEISHPCEVPGHCLYAECTW